MAATFLDIFLLVLFFFVLYRSYRAVLQHRSATTEPTCATCGYAVVGLTTPTCPECGSNLLASGILPPGKIGLRIGTSLIGSFILFLVFVLFATLLGLIQHYERDASFDISPTSVNGAVIIVHLYGEGYVSRVRPTSINVYGFGESPIPGASTAFTITEGWGTRQTLVPAGPRGTISYVYRAGDWAFTDPVRPVRTGALTDAEIDGWLAAIGIPSDPARSHELRETIIAAKNTPDLEHFTLPPLANFEVGGRGSGGIREPASALQFANAWLFAILWAYSLRYSIVGRPRALRGGDAAMMLSTPTN